MPELQRSAEWFEARKGRVTGSVAGAILGMSPYMAAEDVLRSMVRDFHGAEREFTGNVATEWGQAMEDGACFDFMLETGLNVKEVGFFKHGDWLGASPDGEIADRDALIEIKCPFGLRNDKSPAFKRIEEMPHYYAQMQLEMFCADRTKCYFYQWTPNGTDLQVVELDKEWLETYLPKLRNFYDLYLTEVDNKRHLEPLRKKVSSNKAIELLDEIEDLSATLEQAQERKKELMEELVKECGEQNCEIAGKLLTKVEKKGSVSYAKAIKELLPDANLEKYRGKPSSYWKIS